MKTYIYNFLNAPCYLELSAVLVRTLTVLVGTECRVSWNGMPCWLEQNAVLVRIFTYLNCSEYKGLLVPNILNIINNIKNRRAVLKTARLLIQKQNKTVAGRLCSFVKS